MLNSKILLDFCKVFKKLQKKWKVKGLQLILILSTFAIGGSLCGFIGRKLLGFFSVDSGIVWLLLYILLITILWPLCVIIISIPLGQLPFFKNYLQRIASRVNGKSKQNNAVDKSLTHIAIFASGNGSNAEKIITSSPSLLQKEKPARASTDGDVAKNNGKIEANHKVFKVALIVCNKASAGVLKIATANNIPTLLIEKERFFNGDAYLEVLKKNKIDFIVLAGFLWKIPAAIINAYPNKIINIHPALLPKHGGIGMYGMRVHNTVIAAKEKESGITIHYVDEQYDNGDIIFQAKCAVDENDSAETLAKKIQALEHEHYPAVIEQVINFDNEKLKMKN